MKDILLTIRGLTHSEISGEREAFLQGALGRRIWLQPAPRLLDELRVEAFVGTKQVGVVASEDLSLFWQAMDAMTNSGGGGQMLQGDCGGGGLQAGGPSACAAAGETPCVCCRVLYRRDDYKMTTSKTAFEEMIETLPYKKKRSYTCPKGTIANAFSDNPVFNENVGEWDGFHPLPRIIKLRDELRKQLKL